MSNTTQRVERFYLSPDFDILMRPAAGGELLTDPEGWGHYAWHVVLMCRDQSMSLTYRTGTGITKTTANYLPIIPDARDVLMSIAADAELVASVEDLAGFVTEYEYEDIRKAIDVWDALQRQHADLKRLFPLHVQHFIDTYRED